MPRTGAHALWRRRWWLRLRWVLLLERWRALRRRMWQVLQADHYRKDCEALLQEEEEARSTPAEIRSHT
jgi:hypothetical protein